MDSSDRKTLFSFIAGAAAGAAVASYLRSDQGQQTVKKVRAELGQLEGEFESRMKEQLAQIQSSMNKVMEQTSVHIESATNDASERLKKLQVEAQKVIESAKPEASPKNGK
jgi:succinate dehydrogenase/fumarate reductase flavoprotein subunit